MLSSFFKKLSKSTFFRNTLTLVSGSVVAQGFSFILLIILQRWFYTPADFGVLTFFTSFSAIFIALSTLKYEYAIILEKDKTYSFSIAILCFISVVAFTILSAFVLGLFPSIFFKSLSASSINLFQWAVPLIILFSGIFETLNYWNNSENKFSNIAYGRILQNVSTESTRLGLAPLALGGKALIIGRLVGQFLSSIFLFVKFLKEIKKLKLIANTNNLKKVASIYRDFPIFTMPTVVINNLTTWYFVYKFYNYYGGATMGFVSIAIQYIALPLGIISSAFSQVFFKKISDIKSKSDLLRVYKSFSLRLTGIGLLGVLIVFSVPNQFIIFILGETWSDLSVFMRIAILWQTVAFISSSLSFIYTRLLKQRLMVFYALLQFVIVICTLTIGNSCFKSPIVTFQIFVAGQILYYLFAISSAFRFIKKSKILAK